MSTLRQTLAVVGDVPSLMLMEAAWTGMRTEDDFQSATRLPLTTVRSRLDALTAAGLLTGDGDGRWRVTPAGMDFYSVAVVMLGWETRWNEQSPAARVKLRHQPCNRILTPRLVGPEAPTSADDEAPAPFPRRRLSRDSVDVPRGDAIVHGSVRVLGDRWAGLILWALRHEDQRFGELKRRLTIASNILTERLQWLTGADILTRAHASSHAPYILTAKGRGFLDILDMVESWGAAWLEDGVARHRPHKSRRQVLCAHCGLKVAAQDVSLEIPPRRLALG
ncbi:winged helix-turn-helix transcriptional regulator [Brevundimonas staleyi]|uniref:Winged helix-turn-helix transcriptional regulator n=1 Tax=Brevundimonas staleyi TaxID=74326 RepID=A0ABW0FNU8_9CAUL